MYGLRIVRQLLTRKCGVETERSGSILRTSSRNLCCRKTDDLVRLIILGLKWQKEDKKYIHCDVTPQISNSMRVV